MKIIEELNFDYSIFAHLIPDGSKVLFLKPKDVNYLKYFINQKGCECSAIHSSLSFAEECRDLEVEIKLANLNSDIFLEFKNKEFNYVVSDENIHDIRYGVDFIKNISRISDKVIISFINFGYFKRRLRFLFSGSLFSFDILKNYDEAFWDNQKTWQYSFKDIKNIINIANCLIENGLYYDKSQDISSIYDIRCHPSLFGIKFFLILTNDIGQKMPSYKLSSVV